MEEIKTRMSVDKELLTATANRLMPGQVNMNPSSAPFPQYMLPSIQPKLVKHPKRQVK